MKITVLVEDETIDGGLAAEHGLSLYIEFGGKRILFDAGTTSAFTGNADKLGVDLSAVDFAVVSHGHYDHTGGLPDFFAINDSAPVYMKREAAGEQFASRDGAGRRYIGVDRRLFGEHAGRIRYVSGAAEPAPGCHIVAEIPAEPHWVCGDANLFVLENEQLVKDAFRHELMLALVEDGGMALITGCSHLGVVNLLRAARKTFPGLPVKAVAGGLHLFGPTPDTMNCSEEFLDEVAEELKTCCAVYAGHCTGRMAFGLLKERLGVRLRPLNTGNILVI
jgi:7,8-dihydropterin-6-yl-methyl-4-(beta-D-ribofuranosyl)aminobenzene 5'-phosphate synthase